MKKILLSVVVYGFVITGSAQQNSFLDLQLQKRKKETTTTVKPLLQNPVLQKRFYNLQPVSSANPGTLSHLLPNGDKVYLLAQDNMPCIVPDMSRFKTTGIYGKGEITLIDKIGSIPNAAGKPKTISR